MDPHRLQNYRPIALLSVTYKIFTQLIRARLQAVVDSFPSPTQFGFRPNRSTIQPIHILRRLQETADNAGDSLHAVFLDWEKAFDSVPHQKLIESLALFGIPGPYLSIIASLYFYPQFQVKVGPQASTWHTQKCGIRQGCPLSPYLFTILMDVLFHEVSKALPAEFHGRTPLGFPHNHLLYADDTLLVSRSASQLTLFLQTLQLKAAEYGLTLNLQKSVHIPMHSLRNIYFRDGSVVPKEVDTTYLGAKYSTYPDPGLELDHRLQACYSTWRKLFLFLEVFRPTT